MYYTDSPTGAIWLFDYDRSTGAISNRRDFVASDDADKDGLPDGMTVDAVPESSRSTISGYHMRYVWSARVLKNTGTVRCTGTLQAATADGQGKVFFLPIRRFITTHRLSVRCGWSPAQGISGNGDERGEDLDELYVTTISSGV